MRLRVLAVGKKMPLWVDQGVNEYARRLPREISVEWLDIPPAKRRASTAEKYRSQEADAICAKLSNKDYLIALDVAGREISTEMIARRLDHWQMQGQQISIAIGGPDGLHQRVLTMARERWSFGRLTMPHPLVRVVLSEQLYRAWSIKVGHPYHRGM